MIGSLAISLALGILAAELTRSLLTAWVFLGLGLILLFFRNRRQLGFLALFFAIGVLLAGYRLDRLYDPTYGKTEVFAVEASGFVREGEGYWAWQGTIREPADLAGAIVLVYSETYSPGYYRLQGILRPPVQYRNPGQGWHYKRKLYAGEIGVLSYPQILSFQERGLTLLERTRDSYRRNIVANIPDKDSAGLALALTTGKTSLLPEDVKAAVYLTGVGHLLAMSGLHVGILLGIFLSFLRRLGFSRPVASSVGLGGVMLFLIFAGPSPSLVRAVLMSAWGIAAAILGREKQGLLALEWTCLIMLLYNPLWLFDYAFVFSIIATFICLKAAAPLDALLSFLPPPIRRTGALSLLIQLTALPLSIYLFGSSSLWGPVANMVLIPLMPLMTSLAMATGFLPGVLGSLAALPAKALLGGVARFISLLAEYPLSFRLGGLGLVLTAIACSGLIFYLAGVSLAKILRLLGIGLLVSLIVFSFMTYGVTTVWFLDVGQGDSILIRRNGQWLLVDCGDGRAGERAVLPTLQFLGVNRLKAIVLTHPHEDHIGGALPVLAGIPVEAVYSNYLTEYAQGEVVRYQAEILPGVVLMSHDADRANLNDTSLLVSMGGNELLLTGDIEAEGEQLYMHRLSPHSVLKVAHHGSNTSSSQEFLALVQPQAAIISCGLGNSFGMPREETLRNLEEIGASILRTDLDGFVRVDFWPWGHISISSFGGR